MTISKTFLYLKKKSAVTLGGQAERLRAPVQTFVVEIPPKRKRRLSPHEWRPRRRCDGGGDPPAGRVKCLSTTPEFPGGRMIERAESKK